MGTQIGSRFLFHADLPPNRSSWTPARENRRTRGLRRDDLLRKASNDNRRRAGIGIVGRWFNRTYKDYYDLPEKVIQKIKDPEIYR